ncbi:MAG: T9SS type A sorting domain-containing protein, partial [Saprospiraceae bacterium]|nr:T9SS type A sorting domain-containing protein [Saprospiraceae bacterium]
RGWNETMIAYILGIGSPTHPLPRNTYHNGWAGQNYENGNTYYGLKLEVGRKTGGPLFFTHYSFLGFDPRGKRDDYANYFFQNQNQTLINRAYCMDNPGNFAGYGPDCWGLTASDDPFGYSAHAPDLSTDNGTITPSAAISSIPYTPVESIRVVRHFLETYGERIWGEYGFHDAFNPSQGWFATSYLAIDQGPIICMIENHRSQLLWNHFMQNEEVIIALEKIGFTQDDATTSIPDYDDRNTIDIFPNPTHSGLHLSFARLEKKPLRIILSDYQGKIVMEESYNSTSDQVYLELSSDITPGLYILKIDTYYRTYFENIVINL